MVHSAMVQYLYYCNVLYDLHLRGKFERLENKLLYREGLTSFQGTGVPGCIGEYLVHRRILGV